MFLNSTGVLFRECLFKFDDTKEEFHALQLAIPSFIDEINSYNKQTEINLKTIAGLIESGDHDDSDLDKEGYLWKKGDGIGKIFHKRYITIKENKLTYYKEFKDRIENRGCMDLLTTTDFTSLD